MSINDKRNHTHANNDDGAFEFCRPHIIAGLRSPHLNAMLIQHGYTPVSKQLISQWRKRPELQEAIRQANEEALKYGIARRVNRIAGYDRLLEKLEDLMAERAVAYEEGGPYEEEAQGGETGLIVREVKMIGQGAGARETIVYRLDSALIDSYLNVCRQASTELGQWVNRSDLRLPDENEAELTDDERVQRLIGVIHRARTRSGNAAGVGADDAGGEAAG